MPSSNASTGNPASPSERRRGPTGPGMPGLYLLVLAGCGWLILMANMFGFAGATGWIFPQVTDISGLAASTLLLALLGLTPLALRQLIRGTGGRKP